VSCAPATSARRLPLSGWVHRQRDHGGVTFIDLRDRSVSFNCRQPNANTAAQVLQDARMEWVLQVTGVVRRRPAGAENPNLTTGEIEVEVTTCEALNRPSRCPS